MSNIKLKKYLGKHVKTKINNEIIDTIIVGYSCWDELIILFDDKDNSWSEIEKSDYILPEYQGKMYYYIYLEDII